MRQVKGCRLFRHPLPGHWWRDRYPDSQPFDLDKPEDVAYLQTKGVLEVELDDGSRVRVKQEQG